MRIGAHVLLCRLGFVKLEDAIDRQAEYAGRGITIAGFSYGRK